MSKWTTIWIALGFFVLPSSGQPVDESPVLALRDAYQNLEYDRVEELALKILDDHTAYAVEQLVEAHITLALVRYTQTKQSDARQHFISALSLNPALELDPVLVSPKVRTFFETIKDALPEEDTSEEPGAAARYIFVNDPRPSAAIRSLVLPGWGQFYKEHRTKAWVITGAWAGAAATASWAHVRRQRAAREYRRAREPGSISSTYNTYNRLHKTRNTLAAAAAGIWLYSFFDALMMPSGKPPASRAFQRTLTLEPHGIYSYPQVRVVWSF